MSGYTQTWSQKDTNSILPSQNCQQTAILANKIK